ncbi:hypothetical protein [Marinicella rhabdoformis]|uniref:hypothetical protein n=1 Tax=Marinicella rhabdoformis TaxID=2580566 RepID=UPI0012AECD41|nr:hypothetical protein [Marinicella rhabdoformis]
MKRILVIYAIAVFITACANHRGNYLVSDVVEAMERYDGNVISVKGYLHISESLNISLYHIPKGEIYLDLAFDLEILPREKYIPGKFYCVFVRGKFIQYTEDLILLGAISPYGRVDVKLVEHCE